MNSSSNSQRAVTARGADAVAAISGSRLSSSENLPMLSVIAERYALLLPIAARQGSLPPIETTNHSVHTVRYGDAVDALPKSSIAAVINVSELGSQVLIALEGRVARVLLHSMLGGKPETVELERKSFTHIDRRIAVKLMDRLLSALAEAFAPFAKITPKVDNVDVQVQFATVLPRVASATTIKVGMVCESVTGELTVIIPRSALDPIRETLSHAVIEGDTVGGHWFSDLKKGASALPLTVSAVLGTLEFPLSAVLGWRVGTNFELPPMTECSVSLVSGETTIAVGRSGKVNSRMGVLVSEVVTSDNIQLPSADSEKREIE